MTILSLHNTAGGLPAARPLTTGQGFAYRCYLKFRETEKCQISNDEGPHKLHLQRVQPGSSMALAAARPRFSQSILDHYRPPKEGLNALICLPRGDCGSIWALVGVQVLTLSATSGESCAKSGYSWPQTCPKSNQNQILAAFWWSDMAIFRLEGSAA